MTPTKQPKRSPGGRLIPMTEGTQFRGKTVSQMLTFGLLWSVFGYDSRRSSLAVWVRQCVGCVGIARLDDRRSVTE